MKKYLVILLATAFVSFVFLSCQTREQEIDDARQNLKESKESEQEAEQKLSQALTDSTDDYNDFKLQSEMRIKHYEKKMLELKALIAKEKRGNKSDYEKFMADLEHRNQLMKQNLKDFKTSGKDNLELFKVNVNKSLDSLGNSITDGAVS